MSRDTDILITGGYGTVGRRVAADLAPDYPGRVVVAGRSAEKAVATRSGARIVLGSGLALGISSLLARLGANRVGAVEKVEVGVLLSVGDAYGPASRAYLLEEISLPYAVCIEGRELPTRPFAASARVNFPPPLGGRTAYLFPFSDQVLFPETLGARTALSRLALEPPGSELCCRRSCG